MKKHLPIDDFEREVQRLADGFEIQPRAMVFEHIQNELAFDTPVAGKGKILKGIFSKSLHFISYAAAASVATVGTVLVYQQQESVHQQKQTLLSFTKIQTTQSQTLTQRLSDTISTLAYETAANNLATGEFTENTVSSNDQPVTSFEGEPVRTVVNEHEQRNVQPNYNVIRTTTAPGLAKQVKFEEKPVTATTGENTKQPRRDKTIKSVAQESINTANSTILTVQQSETPDQSQQSIATESVQVPNSSEENVVANKQVIAVVVQDSALASPITDSAVTIASVADTAGTDTTGSKRSLAARNWIKKGVWSVAAFYSYEANKSSLNVPLSSDPGYYYETYNSFISKTSVQNSSYTAGFRVDYSFLHHWGISTGVTYAERKEQLSVDKHHELEYDLVTSIWGIQTTTTAGYSQRTTNVFSYLEIPVLINYTNTIAGRFAYRLTAGVSYAYLMKQSASYIDMQDRLSIMGPAPVYHQSDRVSETPFRQHNMNLQLGAYLSYLAGKRVEVFAGPNFKRSLLSTFNRNYPFIQKFQATGAEAGVRYFF